MNITEKLQQLSDEQLLQLADELKNTSVSENALIRDIIKGTEMDTSAPVLAFVAIGQLLTHVLADRLRSYIANTLHCSE